MRDENCIGTEASLESMFRQGRLLDVALMNVNVQLSIADTQQLTPEWVS